MKEEARYPVRDCRLTLGEYLRTPIQRRPIELIDGVVREPAAPFWAHQAIVKRLSIRLDRHATRFGLGEVGLPPLDLILDPNRPLVVQPDLLFVARHQSLIIKNQVWAPPDLVVEILSNRDERSEQIQKVGWYQQYGVREVWLVKPVKQQIEVLNFDRRLPAGRATFEGVRRVKSRVLPRLRLLAGSIFE